VAITLEGAGTPRSMPRWGLLVVVAGVLPGDSFEVPFIQDEQPVEAFGTNGPHPTLRVGIGPRRSDACLDHPDALGAKHLVEGRRELGVPIPDPELDISPAVGQVTHQVGGSG
jgi:hypothetical protein